MTRSFCQKVVDRGRQLRRAFEPGQRAFRLAVWWFVLVRRMYIKEWPALQSFLLLQVLYCSPKVSSIRGFKMIRRRRVSISRVVVATLFLTFGVLSANAYTIVMQDGRRLEIPDNFTVTGSTVTYEAGSDIQVTIQLNTVDVAATERANNEAPGVFLRKANAANLAVDPVSQARSRAGRSITNADLEPYRRARVEGEKDYERQRRELGLPSREERAREVAEIQDRTLEQVRYMRERQEMEEAAYWRGRAESMRAGSGASQAELDFWRSQVGGGSIVYPDGGFFPNDGFGMALSRRRFGRLSDPFQGFLSTPITPFPRFPSSFRRSIFVAPGRRIGGPRPSHGRGHRR